MIRLINDNFFSFFRYIFFWCKKNEEIILNFPLNCDKDLRKLETEGDYLTGFYFFLKINNIEDKKIIKVISPFDGFVEKVFSNKVSFIIRNYTGVRILVHPILDFEKLSCFSLSLKEKDFLNKTDHFYYLIKDSVAFFDSFEFYIIDDSKVIEKIKDYKIILKK